jgi:hypothetical protein
MFVRPETFLTRARPASPDPLEQTPRTVELVDPSPVAARQAARDTARLADLEGVDVDDLVLVVMESFFSLLQKNMLDRRPSATREELRIAIVRWIERTYHRHRRQAALSDD